MDANRIERWTCIERDAAPADATRTALVAIARELADDRTADGSLAALARRAGLSPFHFQRRFKSVLGVTPKQLQRAARVARLKTGLREGKEVLDAIFDAGFASASRAYQGVDRELGMTPGAYRRGGAGETIHFAARRTPIGVLMMAATARGVCFVELAGAEAPLRTALAREFPAAALVRSRAARSPELDRWMDALDAHLRVGGPCPELPLDLRGTAFQIRVWRFLSKIPTGETRSYGEVAVALGAPRAARAVASACAANRIALLVPCHRVLRGDGGIGGYRWGVERKRDLLERERAAR